MPEGRILEIGVGTGINFEYYPDGDREYTGIDISPRMLSKATARARNLGKKVTLLKMDAGHLDFPPESFDAALTTCVLCSVPFAVDAIREMHRVLKKDGTAFFLEHMRPDKGLLGLVFDIINPLTSSLVGVNINRRTVENIREAGFEIVEEQHLLRDIFRFIAARP